MDFEYTLSGDKYTLSSIDLDYKINKEYFPNATKNENLTASASDLDLFSATKGSSYRCNAKTIVSLGPFIKFDLYHYQGEAFYSSTRSIAASKFHTGELNTNTEHINWLYFKQNFFFSYRLPR